MQWAKKQTQFGFTIVELLIVIVVIAILAAITVVAYGAVRQRATESLMMNTAEYVAKEMQNRRTLDGVDSFAQTLPAGLDLPEKIGVATTDTGDPQTFCINVTHADFNDVYFSIKNDDTPKKELCEGVVVAASEEYNAAAGTDGGVALVREVCAGVYGFCVERSAEYDALNLSWDSQGSDVTYYNINSRLVGTSTWYSHESATGTPSGSETFTATSYSNRITSGTTSLTWSNQATIPQPGTGREFRFRYYIESTATYSDWTYVTLEREELPAVANFKITPADNWSGINITWDNPGEQSEYNGFYYNIVSRAQGSGSWYSHSMALGEPSGSETFSASTYSNRIVGSTTSVPWSSQATIPQPGTSREFRIRTYTINSSGSGGAEKYGPWVTVNLERPALSEVAGFTVSPNSSWSNVTVAWNNAAGTSDDLGFYYNINSRLAGASTWYAHESATGNPSGSETFSASNYSNRIGGGTNSLTWSNQATIPQPGTSREFRIRTYTINSSGSGGAEQYSPWVVFTLTRSALPNITGFTVTPNGSWSNLAVSWNNATGVSDDSGFYYNINSRAQGASTWYSHLNTSGNPSGSETFSASTYSNRITGSTTNLSWSSSNVIPISGTSREFRIRAYTINSSGSGGAERYGDWTYFTLTRP